MCLCILDLLFFGLIFKNESNLFYNNFYIKWIVLNNIVIIKYEVIIDGVIYCIISNSIVFV